MATEFPGGKQQEVHDIAIHFTTVQCQVSASLAARGQCVRGTVHLIKEAQLPAHVEAAAGAIMCDLVTLLSQLETCEFGVERLVTGLIPLYPSIPHSRLAAFFFSSISTSLEIMMRWACGEPAPCIDSVR
jgi:pyrrolidone-carboxylate peptidase